MEQHEQADPARIAPGLFFALVRDEGLAVLKPCHSRRVAEKAWTENAKRAINFLIIVF